MRVHLDGHFWSAYFTRTFIPQIDVFCNVLIRRVLPGFESIGREADEVADAEFKRIGRLPIGEYDAWDTMDAAADQAFEAGLTYYESLEGVRQSLLNLAVVALHHMFEQQLLLFHRRQVLHPRDEHAIAKISMGEMKRILSDGGVALESLASWPRVEELRIVANSVKHGEGRSSEQLKEVRPDLLTHPSDGDGEPVWTGPNPIYLPLAGEDIYVTTSDLECYRSAIVAFWTEFGESIKHESK